MGRGRPGRARMARGPTGQEVHSNPTLSDSDRDSDREPGPDMHRFSMLAGPLTQAPSDGSAYRVRYAKPLWLDSRLNARTFLLTGLSLTFEVGFVFWLLRARHFPHLYGPMALRVANVVVASSIAVVEVLRLINVVSLAIASVTARNPVPVVPPNDLRVAFATTIVPDKEPLDLVRATLRKAKAIRYAGHVDVWLLDEGNDPDVKRMCTKYGVRHFSRWGVERWNQPKGAFKARSKHGNYNSWVDAHGGDYDVLASVDPDHAPTENYLERMLGYFRDPDVAYVVAPQNYANGNRFVTAAAESQQFPFHAIIQRAANRAGCSMLVGTNNAIRISALKSIGGLRDSVTEDMATGLYFHTSRNSDTGRRWKSIYTPDVLAHGEGPSTWTDFFSQQMRWSRGTFEVIKRDYWRRVWRLRPNQLLHYGLIMSFYPSMAIAWTLGGLNCLLYLVVGASGIHVPVTIWLALYADTTATQLLLYVSNRRYNVSPYELDGSYGVTGMLMSIIASPIYASSLLASILGRPARFVVTPKGVSSTTDSMAAFRRHLRWASMFVISLAAGLVLHHASPLVCFWPLVAIGACLLPIGVHLAGVRDASSVLADRAASPPLTPDERLAELGAEFGTVAGSSRAVLELYGKAASR